MRRRELMAGCPTYVQIGEILSEGHREKYSQIEKVWNSLFLSKRLTLSGVANSCFKWKLVNAQWIQKEQWIHLFIISLKRMTADKCWQSPLSQFYLLLNTIYDSNTGIKLNLTEWWNYSKLDRMWLDSVMKLLKGRVSYSHYKWPHYL